MKKKGILTTFSIIFLIILMPNVFSIYEELVYSGTVEDRDVVNISGHIFEFRIDSVSNKVLVEIDVSGIIIVGGECKIKDNLDICISNISFSYRNLTEYYDVYKALVKVYQVKSKLDITNTLEKNNFLIDEEVTGSITIENTADIAAEDVTAILAIPSNILITDVEGCKKTSESIIFQDTVYPGIRTCTYKARGLSGNDFLLTTDVSYFDGIDQINTTSNTINGGVYNYSLKITPKLNKSQFDIKEEFDLIINIENINDQHALTITTMNIKLPEKLLLIKKPKDTISNNRIISWSGTLASKENKDFVIKLQSQRTGNYSILTEASYKIDKFFRKAEESTELEVYCDCPYIYHDFSQQIAVPDQRIGLKAFITNPSLIHDFRNVKIDYHTDIPNIQDFSTAYPKINPFETIKIFDSSIITPSLDGTYHFNITSVYESSGNQVFVVKDNIIIKIPSIEEKVEDKETKEQELVEEQQEIEDVSLGTKEPEDVVKEPEKETSDEEIPVTILEDEKEPIKVFTIIAYIAGIIFILVVLIIFKIKKSEKKGPIERQTDYNKDYEYIKLKKQIEKLGITPEGEQTKTGLFGRIFKKK